MSAGECGAKARTNQYRPCRQPAMANGRCRLHGGKSIGPRTEEGLSCVKEANTTHGFYTAEAIMERKATRMLLKGLKSTL